jgi:hypothetical protein
LRPRKPRRRSPSGKTAHEKGKELENAIGAIERTILRANPNLSEQSYTITFRKIITVDGVKHEIDVWIEFDNGDGYKSIFIFEARNWDKTIGKDHIFAFSAKIAAASAQTGYFVAKSVSKFARAAAKKDARVKLLKATDDFAASDRIKNFHVTHQDQSKSVADFEVVVKPRPEQPPPSPTLNMNTSPLTLNGVAIDYAGYANFLVSQVIQEHSLTVPSHQMEDGTYPYEVSKDVVIPPNVMLVDGYEVQLIKIKVRYLFEVVRARVVSKFDIETRGRVHVYEGIPLGAFGTQHITIVERDHGSDTFSVNVENIPASPA